jgi:hypothetical protein
MLPDGRASCLISSLPSPHVFGWLLRFNLCVAVAKGHGVFLFLIYSVAQFAMTWQGCCWRSCSRHQPPHRLTVMTVAVACQWWRQRQYWQRGNKVNKKNNNGMTTTQQPT